MYFNVVFDLHPVTLLLSCLILFDWRCFFLCRNYLYCILLLFRAKAVQLLVESSNICDSVQQLSTH